MTFTQYTKFTTKPFFCLLLLLTPIQKVKPQVPVFVDAIKAGLLTTIAAQLPLTLIPLSTAKGAISDAGDNFGNANSEITATLNTLKQYDGLFPAWEVGTDPSTTASTEYVTNVTAAENALKNLTTSDKLTLNNLEKDNFDNTDADNNSALQHSQGNNNHETVFKNGVLCPSNPKSIGKDYSTLQYKACNIINNATAYKIKLSESAQKKQKVIDNAIVDILKKSPRTMGNFEARRVALSDLQALQKNVIDEYDLKAKNADLQIKIAEEARRYASEAMLVGPTKNTTRIVAVDAFKFAVATVLNKTIPATIPYNE